MCDVTIAAAQTLTADDLALLNHDDLPSPTGMLHPARQLPRHGRHRGRTEHTAPPLTPSAPAPSPTAPRSPTEMRTALTDYRGHARADADRWEALHTAAGLNEDDQVDEEFEYHPGDEIDDRDNLFIMRFLYAFWSGGCASRTSPNSTTYPSDTPPAYIPSAPVSPPTSVSSPSAPPHGPHRISPPRPATGSTAGSCACTRSASGTRPSSATRSSTVGAPHKGPADKPMLGGEVVRSMTRRLPTHP